VIMGQTSVLPTQPMGKKVNKRLLVCCAVASLIVLCLHPGPGLAQGTPIPAKHHPWGCFRPGAWKLVRELTETLDEHGLVKGTSTTETKTTLMSVDSDGVTLGVEVVVEVAGKRVESAAEIVRQGFHGEPICDDLKVGQQKDGEVTIEGRTIPCKIIQLECPGPTGKTVADVYYTPDVPPYVLKRTSTTSSQASNSEVDNRSFEVVSLDMPCKVMAEIANSADVKEVRKYPKGTITTRAITSTAVPGGIISHRSKEVDNSGRVVRRSILELVGYGLVADQDDDLLRGLRRSRFRKSGNRYVPW
jgi:hypothetical protein